MGSTELQPNCKAQQIQCRNRYVHSAIPVNADIRLKEHKTKLLIQFLSMQKMWLFLNMTPVNIVITAISE